MFSAGQQLVHSANHSLCVARAERHRERDRERERARERERNCGFQVGLVKSWVAIAGKLCGGHCATGRQIDRQAGTQTEKQAALRPITFESGSRNSQLEAPTHCEVLAKLAERSALVLFLARVFAALGWGPKDSFHT